jgi:hypothetical protein
MNAKPDPAALDTAIAFINRIFGMEPFGVAILAFLPPGSDRWMHEGLPLDRDWQPLARRHLTDYWDTNCYLAVALYDLMPEHRRGENRTLNRIGHCRWLYCERDGSALPDILPPPTITVETSPGHYHDWWQLNQPVKAKMATQYIRRIAAAVGVGDAKDATRVLRIPGTINRKPARDGFVVRVERDMGQWESTLCQPSTICHP